MAKKVRRKVARRTGSKKFRKKIKSNIEIENNPEYGLAPNKTTLELEKYKRELRRTRDSASFRVGNLIIESVIRPWKLILLPFKFILISWQLASEILGMKRTPTEIVTNENVKLNKKTIVVFPTNGIGFGHFTRLLAISKQIKKREPEIEIIFFTTMSTLHLLKEQGGFVGYHIPGRKKFPKMDARTWNTLTEEFIENVFSIHKPSMFIFDGAFPYRGMLNSIRNQKNMKKFWLRRGTFKKGVSNMPIDSINHFDYIIRPKDSVEIDYDNEEDFNPDLITCDPILLLNKEELEIKSDVLAKLAIPENSIVVYVQLGAGNINDIDSEMNMTLDALSKYEDIYVVLGESMIGSRLNISGERIRIIRDYPNSRFFDSFDFGIMAAGYNSYHEAIQFSLPTIFYPNLNTGRDDQFARAKVSEEIGAMVVLRKRTKKNITAAIEKLYNNSVRKRMKDKCAQLHKENGADQIAKFIVKEIKNF